MFTKAQILEASKQLQWAEEMGSFTDLGGGMSLSSERKTPKKVLVPLQIPDVSPETFAKKKKTTGLPGGSVD